MKKSRKLRTAADWASPGGRVRWLLQHRWDGSRSAMANETKVSLRGIIKVARGEQEPGRRLLTTITENTDVDPGWLLTGQGEPFTSSAIPVTHQVLPGTPQDHKDLFVSEKVEGIRGLYSPSRYWLKVQAREPIVRDAGQRIKAGDFILLDTDKEHFPPKERLDDTLCVIRIPQTDPPQYKLAEVSYEEASIDSGPERIEADTFDLGPEVYTQTIIEESPDGETLVFKRRVRYEQHKGPGRLKSSESTMVRPADMDYPALKIEYEDIFAVYVLLLRR